MNRVRVKRLHELLLLFSKLSVTHVSGHKVLYPHHLKSVPVEFDFNALHGLMQSGGLTSDRCITP